MTKTPTARQVELTQLATSIQRGNYNGETLRRFRELVEAEARPAVDAAMQRAMPQLVAHARTMQDIRNEQRRLIAQVSRDIMARYRRGEFNRRR